MVQILIKPVPQPIRSTLWSHFRLKCFRLSILRFLKMSRLTQTKQKDGWKDASKQNLR